MLAELRVIDPNPTAQGAAGLNRMYRRGGGWPSNQQAAQTFPDWGLTQAVKTLRAMREPVQAASRQVRLGGKSGGTHPPCEDQHVAKKKSAKKSKLLKAKRPVKKAPTAKPAARKAAANPQVAKAEPVEDIHLGRVLVTQEEKLFMLFREDYHARQIFEFLRAETVKDLEQFTPQQIVKLLSQPIQHTVQRIRRKLAEKNRHLAGDEAFVVEFKQKQAGN
jgi:DNA mismatch repair ATPase MutL